MNKEEYIEKYRNSHGLTMADLRKFVHENPQIEGDVHVLIERVEDRYFEGISLNNGEKSQGWGVYKHKGFHWMQMKKFNDELSKAKEILSNGTPEQIENLEYEEEYIKNMVPATQEQMDSQKEQFYAGHCISNLDNDLVLIYSHY